jgi:hypothetical protein
MKPDKLMRENPQAKTGLQDLISLLPDGIVGIEIGSYAGESTDVFIKSGKFVKLYCVDMWQEGYYADRGTGEGRFDAVINGTIAEKVKIDSNTILERFKGLKIDFIYIDGCHKYEQVKKDIENSLILLNGSGILAGHDYSEATPDVSKAIKATIKTVDKEFKDTSWIKFL